MFDTSFSTSHPFELFPLLLEHIHPNDLCGIFHKSHIRQEVTITVGEIQISSRSREKNRFFFLSLYFANSMQKILERHENSKTMRYEIF